MNPVLVLAALAGLLAALVWFLRRFNWAVPVTPGGLPEVDDDTDWLHRDWWQL